jgi:hypothetical protein
LVGGNLTGVFFGLSNIFRMPKSWPIFGIVPAIFTSTAVTLAISVQMYKNKNQFTTPELIASEAAEHQTTVTGSSKLIWEAINKKENKNKLLQEFHITEDELRELHNLLTGPEKREEILQKTYEGSTSALDKIEKNAVSAIYGSFQFFSHFGIPMLAQVFTEDFSLFDHAKPFNTVENLLFWGVLVPIALYNGVQTARETKASYEHPSTEYLRTNVLRKIENYKEPENKIEGSRNINRV